VVTVIISGRPRLLNGCKEASDAVLDAYLPGPMGGQAVAEIIAGQVVPSGRLPFNYPKHHGAIPYPYHRKPSNKCTQEGNGFNYIPCEVKLNDLLLQ
jgi:beta-glucosidase